MTVTKATSYAGALPLNTALGEGIDSEDFLRWMHTNHLSFSQLGWGGDGIFEGVNIDLATYHTPARLARFCGVIRGRRFGGGLTFPFEVELFGARFDVRATLTQILDGTGASTHTASTSGSGEQWVTLDVPLPGAQAYIITLEVKSASEDGIIRQIAPAEPILAVADFP